MTTTLTPTATAGFPSFSGVIPHLAQIADFGPPRSECGIGCLMPWQGKLYVLNYVSHRRRSGTGTGLRVIEPDFSMTHHPAAVDGTYAGRMIHWESHQLLIGPHLIDTQHQVRTVAELVDVRIAGIARHLQEPARLVYVLGMEGELLELDVHTLACRQVADLQRELGTEGEGHVHFKDCFAAPGQLIVCSNEYDEADYLGQRQQGRLASFDGQQWTVLERKPYYAVHGISGFGGAAAIFATGWDRASTLLSVLTQDGQWTRYRLPKATHVFEHKWQTEWPRVREVEHERLLLDAQGMFYELSPHAFGGRIWGVKPICAHLWVVPDFCSWRGLLVLGSDNASPHGPNGNLLTAEPHAGLWFGKTDDLWSFGKPTGWGGPWWDDPIVADVPSDPYLMTGFDQKCLHLHHQGESAATYTLELDFKGCGEFHPWQQFHLEPGGYCVHPFPAGVSAHWLRLVCNRDGVASAQLHYT